MFRLSSSTELLSAVAHQIPRGSLVQQFGKLKSV